MIMKKMVMFLSIILLSFVTINYGQTISIPDTTVAPGTTLNVPIKASNINNVGAVTLKLTYNAAALTFKGFTSGDISFDPKLINANTPGEIKIAWFSTSPVTITNGVIGYVQFTLVSGSSPVSFSTSECELTAIPFATITPTYINGRVGEAAASINVGSIEAKKAETVVVPITAVNLKNIGSMSLSVKYNAASLKFVGFENVASGIIVPSSNTSGTMNVGFFSTSAANFNGKLFDVKFELLGGNSEVSVSGDITDLATKPVSVAFNPGTVKELLPPPPPPVKVGLSIPAIRGIVSKEVSVPVVVAEVNNIGSMSLKINYDQNVLSFKEMKNFVGNKDNLIAKEANGVLTIGYFSTTAISIKNGKLFDMVFTYKGGPTDVAFDNSSTITDGNANTVTINYSKGSVAVNQVPVLAKVADQKVKEMEKLSFAVSAADPENDPLTFTAVNLPKGASFDAPSKTFSWTPSYNDAGNYAVKFFVQDSIGSVDSTIANVSVENVNRKPVFANAMPDTSVAEGATFTFTFKASDPDTLSTLNYTMNTDLKGAALDTKTGVFTFKPDFGTKGTYFVKAYVSDGSLMDSTKSTMVTVNFTNRKPSFTTVMKDTTIAEAQSLSFQFAGSDPDAGQTLTYTLVKSPAGSTIDSKTGLFTYKPDYGKKGTYDLYVSISDGSLKDTSKSKIVVTFTNRMPQFTQVLTPNKKDIMKVLFDIRPPGTKTTDTTFSFRASDPDGQSLKYAIVSGPPAGTQLNVSTGLFRFKPASYGDWKLVISVTDGYVTIYDTTHIVAEAPLAVDREHEIVKEYSLNQNYPNPFNPTTRIQYSIPQDSKVVIKVYNVLGSEVATLVNEFKASGNHVVNFNAAGLPSSWR